MASADARADQSVPGERSERKGATLVARADLRPGDVLSRSDATKDFATERCSDLFREEIKKSYEEYVDQVGREFADSTTHFQDALNEILAAGQKMF